MIMKYFFILIFTAFFSIVSFGQARTGTADYLKAIRPAVIADLSYPVKISKIISNFI